MLKQTLRLIAKPEQWRKENFGGNGCYCLDGALRVAAYTHIGLNEPLYNKCVLKLVEHLPKKKGFMRPYEPVVNRAVLWGFNDHDKTTHRRVVNLLKRAIG